MDDTTLVDHVLKTEKERHAQRLREIEPLVYTVPELARALSISTPKAYELIHVKGFPKLQLRSKYLIPRRALENWLDAQVKAQVEPDDFGG